MPHLPTLRWTSLEGLVGRRTGRQQPMLPFCRGKPGMARNWTWLIGLRLILSAWSLQFPHTTSSDSPLSLVLSCWFAHLCEVADRILSWYQWAAWTFVESALSWRYWLRVILCYPCSTTLKWSGSLDTSSKEFCKAWQGRDLARWNGFQHPNNRSSHLVAHKLPRRFTCRYRRVNGQSPTYIILLCPVWRSEAMPDHCRDGFHWYQTFRQVR